MHGRVNERKGDLMMNNKRDKKTWKTADGGLDDDRAALSGDPDAIYGQLLDMGCSVFMTDRPAQVIESLHRLGRHAALGVVE